MAARSYEERSVEDRAGIPAGRDPSSLRHAEARVRTALAKGVEVVVTRYDKGIAYVRLWTEMSGEEETADRAP